MFLLPKGRGVIISVYDAGMFAVYLIILAWDVPRIIEGSETWGWVLVQIARRASKWTLTGAKKFAC